MIKKIEFETLYESKHDWLTSRFHFSFSEYYNPKNIQYGVLRVLNDDIIAPHRGFDAHPHRDMEIITYVIEGALTHTDSLGNSETIHSGDVQYMSAGTGIVHAEKNLSYEPLHLVQIWILPEAKGLEPNYGSRTFMPNQRRNKWLHIVGTSASNAAISIYQDANIFVSEIENQEQIAFTVHPGRQVYLKILEGDALINGTPYLSGDACEVVGESLSIESFGVKIMLIEMAKDQDS